MSEINQSTEASNASHVSCNALVRAGGCQQSAASLDELYWDLKGAHGTLDRLICEIQDELKIIRYGQVESIGGAFSDLPEKGECKEEGDLKSSDEKHPKTQPQKSHVVSLHGPDAHVVLNLSPHDYAKYMRWTLPEGHPIPPQPKPLSDQEMALVQLSKRQEALLSLGAEWVALKQDQRLRRESAEFAASSWLDKTPIATVTSKCDHTASEASGCCH